MQLTLKRLLFLRKILIDPPSYSNKCIFFIIQVEVDDSSHSTSEILIEDNDSSNAEEAQSCNLCHGIINKELFKEPRLLLCALSQFLFAVAIWVPIIFLPEFMSREHGISHNRAGDVLTFYGIARTAGGIISGIIINWLRRRSVTLSSFTMLGLGGSCITLAYCRQYWQYSILMVLYAIFKNSMIVLRLLVLIDLFGQDAVKDSNCFILFFGWVGTLFSTPIAGVWKAKTGTLSYAFIFAGGVHMFASLPYIIIYCLNHLTNKRRL